MKIRNFLEEYQHGTERELRIKRICDDLKEVAFNVDSIRYRPAFMTSLRNAISDLTEILRELENNKR